MTKPGKLSNGIHEIDDGYLAEVLEYDEIISDHGKKTPSKQYLRWAALVAGICLLLGGAILWGNMGRPKAPAPQEGDGPLQAADTWYVDMHTFLSGKESGVPVEIKGNAKDGETSDGGEIPATQQYVTLTWAYQSFGGPGVSNATVRAINRKLKEDGYHFGVKFKAIEGKTGENSWQDYREKLIQSNADIAFTGFYSEGENCVEEAIREGQFEPLDTYLAGSRYYDQIPEVLWQSVSYQGKIYCFPNEIAQDGGLKLYLKKSVFTKEQAESFSGDLFSLEEYFKNGKVLLDASGDFTFAETFGYSNFSGVLFDGNGRAVNPLEEENCVAWLRLLNDHKTQVVKNRVKDWDFALSRSFPGTGIGDGNKPEDFYVYSWKGYVVPRLNCQTGILSTSKNKEQAFAFLDVLRTDPSYGELLLYGKEYLDGKGESTCSYMYQLIFGLDTGLIKDSKDLDMLHFSTAEEKKRYYEENVSPSPALSLRNPEVCNGMISVRDYVPRLTYTNNFDELLAEARKTYREPMAKILRER